MNDNKESNNQPNVSLGRRKVVQASWISPIVASVALPLHAQASIALTALGNAVSTTVGGTVSILASIEAGISGGTGPYTVCFEDPQNPGTYVESGILDFETFTYDIDTDTITGVAEEAAGVINIKVKDAVGNEADAVVDVVVEAAEPVCGVDACPTLDDLALNFTPVQYQGGDQPSTSLGMIPDGFFSWNGIFEIVGCDEADISTVWETSFNGGAFAPVPIDDPRVFNETGVCPSELCEPNVVEILTSFNARATVSSPGCPEVVLEVLALPTYTAPFDPASQSAAGYDVTISGVNGTVVTGDTSFSDGI